MDIKPTLSVNKRLNKAVALLVALSFTFSNIVLADTPKTDASTVAQKPQEIITDPAKIVIQRDYGLVKAKYTGKDNKRLVIHIQDAHCNFEAQSNIMKILESLVKNDGLSLVSVEGADGFIDTSWFKAFPDAEIRKEVATYFMKKGEITGPEFLSITTDYPIKLFGAETRSYYIENLNAFTSSYPLKEDTEKYFNNIRAAINKLKGYIYSEELKDFDTKTQDYESKKLQFSDYVRYLEALGGKYRVNLRKYDNLFKLVSVLVFEKKINFNVVDKERAALIDTITKKLDKEQLTQLVNKSLEFKTGKISSVEYYEYLKSVAAKYGVSLVGDYPNLFNYIIYNSVYSRIENEELFNDIKKYEEALKEKMFVNDDQRTLEKLSRHINILIGLVNIKLLNGDFDYYKARKEEFTHDAFAAFIKKMADKYGLAFEIETPSEAVSDSMSKLEDFYAIAIKRDKALVDNTLQAMRKENVRICVLVTGGFHSEGITKLLENQGVSYMVVCPNITKDVETPYIKILTNQRTPLEEILSDTAGEAPAKKSMLAPYCITAARMHQRELRSLSAISERVEDDIKAWMGRNIGLWFRKLNRDIANKEKLRGLTLSKELTVIQFNRDMDESFARYRSAADSNGRPTHSTGEVEQLKKNIDNIKTLAAPVIEKLFDAQVSPDAAKAIADIMIRSSNKPALKALVENINAGVIKRTEDLEIVNTLLKIGQAHLFEKWDAPGVNDNGKIAFLEQVRKIDKDFTGGLIQYNANVQRHLADWRDKKNSFQGQIPHPPEFGFDFTQLGDSKVRDRFLKYEKKGLEEAHKSGFVLVAGGLGQRLGYDGIKIDIPVTLATMERYLDTYIRYIAEVQHRSNKLNDTNDIIPVFIMTSDDTDELTRQALQNRQGYIEYGMVPGQITCGKQDAVPSIMDTDGKFGLSDAYKLAVSPHGHGDVHQVLARSGIFDKWVREQKRTHTVYIQDTNAQQCNILLSALGCVVSEGLGFASISGARRAKQQVGALADMEMPDGSSLFRNIEYNVLDKALKDAGQGGDVSDANGLSKYPANFNILIMGNDAVAAVPDRDKGVLQGQEIFNPKFNPDGSMKPGRPEVMMQDIVIPMQSVARKAGRNAKVGHIMFQDRFIFSPVKVSLSDGRKAAANGLNPDSALTAETNLYWANAERLRLFGGVQIAPYKLITDQSDRLCSIGGPYMDGAMIALSSDYAVTGEDISNKFRGGYISSRSSLVVSGIDIGLGNLQLDGALEINTRPGVYLAVEDLKVQNAGWKRVPLTDEELADKTIPEDIRMRGFSIKPIEELLINIGRPGHYTIKGSTLTTPTGTINIPDKGTINIGGDTAAPGSSGAGAIRANGGELTKAEHGSRTYGVDAGKVKSSEQIRNEESVNGAIADLVLSDKATSFLSYRKMNMADKGLMTWTGRHRKLNATADVYLPLLDLSLLGSEYNLVILTGLRSALEKRGIATDLYFHPGVTRKSVYIDEEDLLYLLSLPGGVSIIMQAINHEKAHIDNPTLSEEEIEKLAPTQNVRKALAMRDFKDKRVELSTISKEELAIKRVFGTNGIRSDDMGIDAQRRIAAGAAQVLKTQWQKEHPNTELPWLMVGFDPRPQGVNGFNPGETGESKAVAETLVAYGFKVLFVPKAIAAPFMIAMTGKGVHPKNVYASVMRTASHNEVVNTKAGRLVLISGVKLFMDNAPASDAVTGLISERINNKGLAQFAPRIEFNRAVKDGDIVVIRDGDENDPDEIEFSRLNRSFDLAGLGDAFRKRYPDLRIAINTMNGGMSNFALRVFKAMGFKEGEDFKAFNTTLMNDPSMESKMTGLVEYTDPATGENKKVHFAPDPTRPWMRGKNYTDFVASDPAHIIALLIDGDADRLVAELEKEIIPNDIGMLAAYYLAKYKGQTGRIVRTVPTTGGLDALSRALGLGEVQVTPVGSKWFAGPNKYYSGTLNDILVAVEESGHIGFIKENTTTHKKELFFDHSIGLSLLMLEMTANTGKTWQELADEMWAFIKEKTGQERIAAVRYGITKDEGAENYYKLVADLGNPGREAFRKEFGSKFEEELAASGILWKVTGFDITDAGGAQFKFEGGRKLFPRKSGTDGSVRMYVEVLETERDKAPDLVNIMRKVMDYFISINSAAAPADSTSVIKGAVNIELPQGYSVPAAVAARMPELISTMATQTGLWATDQFKDGGKTMLGWMDLASWRTRNEMSALEVFAEHVNHEKERRRTEHLVIVGQGGSIECIKTLLGILKPAAASPAIHIVDTIDQEVLTNLKNTLPLEKTRFVIISKSMTTMEVHSIYKFFFDMYPDKYLAMPHFTLITDEGKASISQSLIEVSEKVREPFRGEVLARGFSNVFHIEPASGGRYSWDTDVGVLPSLLMGIDIGSVLTGAKTVESESKSALFGQNTAAQYGAFKYVMQLEGRNRPTLMLPKEIKPYGPWNGQLDTESLGKAADRSSVTIDHEELAENTAEYTNKRFFVRIKLGENDNRFDEKVNKLQEAGFPVLTITLPNSSIGKINPHDIGALLKMSEFATAIAGYLMGINPVNQPGVEEYKKAQKLYLTTPYTENPRYVMQSESGNIKLDYKASIEGVNKINEEEMLDVLELLVGTKAGNAAKIYASLIYAAAKNKGRDYAAMMAFKRLSLQPGLQEALNKWRYGVRGALRIDALAEEAPCILHAKQQGFQQGENAGFFTVVRFAKYKGEPIKIPGSDKTFEDLIKAQAIGTLEALSNATEGAVPQNRLGAMIELANENPETIAEFNKFVEEVVGLLEVLTAKSASRQQAQGEPKRELGSTGEGAAAGPAQGQPAPETISAPGKLEWEPESSEALTESERAYANAGVAELVRLEISRTNTGGELSDEARKSIMTQVIGLSKTLNTVQGPETPRKIILLGYDTALDPSSNAAARAGEVAVNKYLKDTLVEVRATGKDLSSRMREEAAILRQAHNTQDIVIMTITGDGTLKQLEDSDKTDLGKILDILDVISVSGMRTIPVIGLYDFVLRVAYGQDIERDILPCLNRIARNDNNKPFTKNDVEQFLIKGLLRIIPRAEPVNMAEAAEIHKAAQAVARAL